MAFVPKNAVATAGNFPQFYFHYFMFFEKIVCMRMRGRHCLSSFEMKRRRRRETKMMNGERYVRKKKEKPEGIERERKQIANASSEVQGDKKF